MAAENNMGSYFKGRFTGLFKQTKKKYKGNIVFSDIQWIHIKIEDCVMIENFDALSHRTGDYWYSRVIKSKNGFNPFKKTTDIFIPKRANEYYSGDLKNVLIKNLKINHEKTYFLHKDWQEASGDIFFQIVVPEVKKKKIIEEKNIVYQTKNIPSLSSKDSSSLGPKFINPTLTPSDDYFGGVNIIPQQSPLILNKTTSSNSWLKSFGRVFTFLIYLLIGLFLWKYFRSLIYVFLFFAFLSGIGFLLRRFSFLLLIGAVAFIGFIAYYLYQNSKGEIPDDLNPVKTRNGKIKIFPPKPEDGQRNIMSSEKEINWFDFINYSYIAKYKTSENDYSSSVEQQKKFKESMNNYSSSTEFFTRFYNSLYRMDDEKINQVAKIFSDSAIKKNMNPLQTAEMVVTFIQEIPYYLVHEESCEKAISSGNDFLVTYHREGKPCLPNISGGVQSPYEFLHNLKGDCDTRSLLGYSILSKLNISSSVWVSDLYGHSIMGIAVPTGHGLYKEINGVKHYGVELTAKGYRIGMVSPEQARPNNWDITLHN